MIGQSQSGTGKTAAFVLTMLSRIDYNLAQVQAICLAPTRELARQIVDVVKEMGKFTPVKVCLAVKEAVQKGDKLADHVVVGTPGTVMDLLRRKALDARSVRVFVLDEADNMLDLQGMGEQSLRVKKYAFLYYRFSCVSLTLGLVLFRRQHRCYCLAQRFQIKFERSHRDSHQTLTKSRSKQKN